MNNPDIHLTQSFPLEVILDALRVVTGEIFAGIQEIEEIIDVERPCVYLVRRETGDFPLSLNIYRIQFSEQNAMALASGLQCVIATDYAPDLKDWQWQLINPDGSVSVEMLIEDADAGDGFHLPKKYLV